MMTLAHNSSSTGSTNKRSSSGGAATSMMVMDNDDDLKYEFPSLGDTIEPLSCDITTTREGKKIDNSANEEDLRFSLFRDDSIRTLHSFISDGMIMDDDNLQDCNDDNELYTFEDAVKQFDSSINDDASLLFEDDVQLLQDDSCIDIMMEIDCSGNCNTSSASKKEEDDHQVKQTSMTLEQGHTNNGVYNNNKVDASNAKQLQQGAPIAVDGSEKSTEVPFEYVWANRMSKLRERMKQTEASRTRIIRHREMQMQLEQHERMILLVQQKQQLKDKEQELLLLRRQEVIISQQQPATLPFSTNNSNISTTQSIMKFAQQGREFVSAFTPINSTCQVFSL